MRKEEQTKQENRKAFIVGRVGKQQEFVTLPFKDAKHFFTAGSVWGVVMIFLPNRYPSGGLMLRRDGGLQDELGREVYIKKTIEGELLKALLREYGFKKADTHKYMLIRVLEDGSLSAEVVNDRVGGYKWMGWGWKYFQTLKDEEEEDVNF